jgi:hypothetical protein
LNHNINPLNKLLQSKKFYVFQATDLLNSSLAFFKELRLDESFENIILEAEELAKEIDVVKNFELIVIVFDLKNENFHMKE